MQDLSASALRGATWNGILFLRTAAFVSGMRFAYSTSAPCACAVPRGFPCGHLFSRAWLLSRFCRPARDRLGFYLGAFAPLSRVRE